MTISDMEFSFASPVPENLRKESRELSQCQPVLLDNSEDQRDQTEDSLNNVNLSIQEEFNFDDERSTYAALCIAFKHYDSENEFGGIGNFCPTDVARNGLHRDRYAMQIQKRDT